nr:hypothetical protein [Acidobacteriota bacterium]
MRIKRLVVRSLISFSALFIFALPAICQVTGGAAAAKPTPPPAPSPPTVPSPPHERLSMFKGTWTIVGYPPERRLRETCDWLPEGRRHMVCRVRFQTPTGPREG